jgi:acetyl-CoA acetyltransferase
VLLKPAVPEAFIIDAVRTPVTRRGGGLAGAHPADLGAHVIKALLARARTDPSAVDDVMFGCVDTVGPQAGDIARTAWLAAGLPEAVPGVTVDRQCGSSQQAVHFAAQAVLSGTAALLIASSRAVREHGLTPKARVVHLSARGDDPVLMLTAPIPATAYALHQAGMSLAGIDLIEINEAFASVVLAWQRETGADLGRVNVCGGAIALGHPLGATGARLLTTLVHALERTGGRYGLLTMCEGGGQANVTIVERL